MSLAGEAVGLHRLSHPDPTALAGDGAVTTDQPSLGLVGLDKLVSRITPLVKVSVPLNPQGPQGASGSQRVREIQLKSLILAQPERWRRG